MANLPLTEYQQHVLECHLVHDYGDFVDLFCQVVPNSGFPIFGVNSVQTVLYLLIQLRIPQGVIDSVLRLLQFATASDAARLCRFTSDRTDTYP